MMELCSTPIKVRRCYNLIPEVTLLLVGSFDCVVNSERSDKHETDDPEINRHMRRFKC